MHGCRTVGRDAIRCLRCLGPVTALTAFDRKADSGTEASPTRDMCGRADRPGWGLGQEECGRVEGTVSAALLRGDRRVHYGTALISEISAIRDLTGDGLLRVSLLVRWDAEMPIPPGQLQRGTPVPTLQYKERFVVFRAQLTLGWGHRCQGWDFATLDCTSDVFWPGTKIPFAGSLPDKAIAWPECVKPFCASVSTSLVKLKECRWAG